MAADADDERKRPSQAMAISAGVGGVNVFVASIRARATTLVGSALPSDLGSMLAQGLQAAFGPKASRCSGPDPNRFALRWHHGRNLSAASQSFHGWVAGKRSPTRVDHAFNTNFTPHPTSSPKQHHAFWSCFDRRNSR